MFLSGARFTLMDDIICPPNKNVNKAKTQTKKKYKQKRHQSRNINRENPKMSLKAKSVLKWRKITLNSRSIEYKSS